MLQNYFMISSLIIIIFVSLRIETAQASDESSISHEIENPHISNSDQKNNSTESVGRACVINTNDIQIDLRDKYLACRHVFKIFSPWENIAKDLQIR